MRKQVKRLKNELVNEGSNLFYCRGRTLKGGPSPPQSTSVLKMENNNDAPMFLLYSNEAHRPNQSEGALY